MKLETKHLLYKPERVESDRHDRDVTHLFVGYCFKAMSLALWWLPLWFFLLFSICFFS